jgi:collagenase-like PrtC family protease
MKILKEQNGNAPPYNGGAYSQPLALPSHPAWPKGLAVPYNFDLALFKFYGSLNCEKSTKHPIRQAYGASPFGIIGHGRGEHVAPCREPLAVHVQAAHDNGIQFAYLWNSPAVHPGEDTTWFMDQLRREADALVAAGVDVIVAAKPNVLNMLRHFYPELRRSSSVNSKIDSVERGRQVDEYFDVHTIMVDHRNSRNFGLIRELRAANPDREIEVLVNESCLRDCALQVAHQAELGAASYRLAPVKTVGLCNALCGMSKLRDLANTLKAPWIRPEDIDHLFEAGASLAKLAGRTEPSGWNRELVTAYARGCYEGDIYPFIEKSGNRDQAWSAFLGKDLEPCRPHVDNKALDGFIKPFVAGTVPCVRGTNGCASCHWCESWMHVVTPPPNREERIRDLEAVLGGCADGSIFSILAEPAKQKAEELAMTNAA